MDIKKLNEKLDYILSEAKIDRNDIDFESVGFGFKVEFGSTRKDEATFNLVGFSNNTEKDVEYVSDSLKIDYNLSAKERKEVSDKLVKTKEAILKDLLEISKDFDKKVVKIMKKHGFTKNSEVLNEDEEENATKLAIFKKAYEALEELQDELYGEIPIDDNKHLDPETVKFLDRLNKMIEEIYSRSLAFDDGLSEKHIESNLNEDLDNEEIYDKFKKAADAIKEIMDYLEDCVDPATGRMEFYTQGFYNNLKNMAIEIESNATAFLD